MTIRRAGLLIQRMDDGRLLLVKRSEHVSDPGFWGLPGGRVEPGESDLDGAIREAYEELGLLPESIEITDCCPYREGHFRYTTFLALVEGSEAEEWVPELNWENSDVGWFSPDELPDGVHPGVVDAVTALGLSKAPLKTLGIAIRPQTGRFEVCKFKSVNPDSPNAGSVHGFIFSPELHRVLTYRVAIIDGVFEDVIIGEDCSPLPSVVRLSPHMIQYYRAQWKQVQSLCIEDVDWKDVADIILADIPTHVRNREKKKVTTALKAHRKRCFAG